MWQTDPIYVVLEKRRLDAHQPNFCLKCNGRGSLDKPISEWDDSEHEYHACPRTNAPQKICPQCHGIGKIGT